MNAFESEFGHIQYDTDVVGQDVNGEKMQNTMFVDPNQNMQFQQPQMFMPNNNGMQPMMMSPQMMVFSPNMMMPMNGNFTPSSSPNTMPMMLSNGNFTPSTVAP